MTSQVSPVATAPAKRRRLGNGLTWLGGADREILELAGSGRNQFVQMGLVVVATAGLGVLSMSFALHTGLHVPIFAAAVGGLVWGCVIAVIDRFLITSLSLRGGLGRVMTIVGVRLVIAALLGVVISTPLVLHVFQREIQAQIVLDKANANKEYGAVLEETPTASELKRVREEIANNEAILKGETDAVVTPEVQSRESYLTQAENKLKSLQATSDQKYRAWQCELYGTSCEGSTNVPGNGNLARAREKEYRDALAQTDAARADVADAERKLTAARNAASKISGDALSQAQEAARSALPGLRTREKQLQEFYSKTLDSDTAITEEIDGILAQIVALGRLGAQNGAAQLTHLAVALLFFMIELLPVLVKILSSLGPPSAYERVRDMVEDATVDNAKVEHRRRTRERDEEERRLIADAKKRDDIEADMRTRERDLGIKANTRVATEMESVLDVALGKWAQEVQRTLHAASAPQHNGTSTPVSATTMPVNGWSNGVAPQPAAHQPAQAQQTVRSNFNLPSGSKLAATNGGTP